MSFSIVNNIPAITAQRQLGQINRNLGKSIERLSTGLRINRSADDAAGLALSERLRARIGGITQGLINSQDAISVVQTAEGGMNEMTQILQRLRVLATNASSAARSDADRDLLQTEVNQLLDELTRIATTTKFGDQLLLDGSIAAPQASKATELQLDTNAYLGSSATPLITALTVGTASLLSPLSNATCFLDEVFKLSIIQGTTVSSLSILVFASGTVLPETTVVASIGVDLSAAPPATAPLTIISSAAGGATFVAVLNLGGLSSTDVTGNVGKTAFVSTTAFEPGVVTDNSVQVQIGANVGEVIKISSPAIKSSSLFSNQPVLLTTVLRAEGVINQVDHALDILNRARSILGAQANRFEASVRATEVFRENLIASESRIRDLNVAQETTDFTKNQILLQTATAFLSQANLIPQSILQLFR